MGWLDSFGSAMKAIAKNAAPVAGDILANLPAAASGRAGLLGGPLLAIGGGIGDYLLQKQKGSQDAALRDNLKAQIAKTPGLSPQQRMLATTLIDAGQYKDIAQVLKQPTTPQKLVPVNFKGGGQGFAPQVPGPLPNDETIYEKPSVAKAPSLDEEGFAEFQKAHPGATVIDYEAAKSKATTKTPPGTWQTFYDSKGNGFLLNTTTGERRDLPSGASKLPPAKYPAALASSNVARAAAYAKTVASGGGLLGLGKPSDAQVNAAMHSYLSKQGLDDRGYPLPKVEVSPEAAAEAKAQGLTINPDGTATDAKGIVHKYNPD